MAVMTPTGSSVGAKSRRATRSEATSSSAPHGGGRGQPERAGADQPAGDLRRHQRDEADRAGRRRGDGGQRRPDEQQRGPDRLDPDAEAPGGVVAQLEHAAGGGPGRASPASARPGRRPTGRTWSQPRPLRLPVSQTMARWASKISARVSRYEVTEPSMAVTPMPTSTSR